MTATSIDYTTHDPNKMPPLLQNLARLQCSRAPVLAPSVYPIAPFLLPFLHAPAAKRNASILSSLSDNPGAFRRKRRVGRGPSSSKGKTSGRGHKGQKQHGKVPAGFQGGQTPLEIVHGKRGFTNKYITPASPQLLAQRKRYLCLNRLLNSPTTASPST